MTTASAFFERISTQLNNSLPFVVYRYPNSKTIKAQFQNTATLEFLESFEQEGFIFAPFDTSSKTIFFANEDAECFSISQDIEMPAVNSSVKYTPNIQEKTQHEHLVEKAIAEINNTDLEKVIVSHNPVLATQTHALAYFKSLLAIYKTAFVYIWYHPQVGLWLGATPETLLQTEGNNFKTMALAGTQVYQEKELKWQKKEIEEQAWVTQSILEDLESSGGAERISTSKTYTHPAGKVAHLRTDITGVFNKKKLGEIVTALHPTPAVCGFPKKMAKDFILKEENYNRQFYTGYLGELNTKVQKTRNKRSRNVENSAYNLIKRQSNLYVNLRCMQVLENKILLYVGGGITKDSKPMAEWEETLNKAKTILQVV
ncbi:chorismate-binding protein [Haloflavibacter putidus]|uniref:Isochorismate synthase n=1 Tax=Haloflavibacter putidus TaxID=2576776 RepID=A0A507ZU39_9FLAO|nr:chorismate-binding protein [Haloflavibacter putidus]TQD40111.1 isochorismate synthase [Haloflavibacter putidus]